ARHQTGERAGPPASRAFVAARRVGGDTVSDTRDLLRPGIEGFEPTPDAFERVLARRDRKRRNERIAAGFVGAAVFALVALWFLRLLTSEPTPAVPRPVPTQNGKWVVISVS